MVYYFKFQGVKVGWKAEHLHDESSEALQGILQELSKGRADTGVRVGVIETDPKDIDQWVTPNFSSINMARPKTLEVLLSLLGL